MRAKGHHDRARGKESWREKEVKSVPGLPLFRGVQVGHLSVDGQSGRVSTNRYRGR